MIHVWIIVLASLVVTALFSAAEMSFIAANRLRLRHLAEAGNRHAVRYLDAFKQPERLLSTTMMGVTIAHITASSVASWALVPESWVLVPVLGWPQLARLNQSFPLVCVIFHSHDCAFGRLAVKLDDTPPTAAVEKPVSSPS